MNYIFCSVLWNKSENGGRCEPSLIAAAKLDEKGDVTESTEFDSETSNGESLIKAFAEWCGKDYLLCIWDGASAGRIKRLFSSAGMDHHYAHMYHLSGVFELSMKKCTDRTEKNRMQNALEHKPGYFGKKNSALSELRWMCSIFEFLDFSSFDKSTSFSFIEQPSNKYFVFKNGKCFHSKECHIVKTAAVSSLRAYTYYSSVIDAGFTPCSRCKPVDNDEQTAEEMRLMNRERLEKAKEKYSGSDLPHRKRHVKKMNVFRSIEHMCGIYGAGYRKSGNKIYITTETENCCIIPDSKEIHILRLGADGEYHPDEIAFADPYSAVRSIIKSSLYAKK